MSTGNVVRMTTTKSDQQAPTQSLLRDIYAVAEFVTSLSADLPDGIRPFLSTHVQLPTRAALDTMAARFGRPAPEKSGHYNGAQFSVPVPGSAVHSTVLFFWTAR